MPLYSNIFQLSDSKPQPDTPGSDGLTSRSQPGPSPTPSNASGGNKASMKLLQDHLLSKKRSMLQQQPAQIKIPKLESKSDNVLRPSELENSLWDAEDEYDPALPNSFEVLQPESIIRLEAEYSKIFAQASSQSSDKFDEIDGMIPTTKFKGASIAPPPSLTGNTILAHTEQGTLSQNDYPQSQAATKMISTKQTSNGGSVAAKIMAKMGFKAGQGLGKDEQGINSPLEIEMSGSNAGRIVSGQRIVNTSMNTQEVPSSEGCESDRSENVTRVLLLQNMVGPGEVDDDLESETKEECKKYGDVIKCLIYEIPNKKVPDNEAVRIFVEFKHKDSTMKAVKDLNGRYFGGRVVRASFYSSERFQRYDLGANV